MSPKLPCPAPSRRALYRRAKRTLYKALMRRWTGPRASLDKHIRAFLRGKRHTYLLRLVRQHAFALAVATALLTGATTHASPPIELSDISMDANAGGFVINGVDAGDSSGFSVSGAGDVNGDGLADLIVGATSADPGGVSSAGESYVVFGKANGAAVELSDVAAGTGGFVINGVGGHSGISVSGAGDVNGDGLADLIVGALNAHSGGIHSAGESYVVFGKADGAPVELADIAMDANLGGFVINGIDQNDYSGWSVSGAGDVNGDGLADLIIGATQADPGGDSRAGESYVVFGKANGAAVALADVAAGTGGFVVNGIDVADGSGRSVSGAGDVNGDGLADLIVGAFGADPGGDSYAGESYVVFSPETAPIWPTYKGYVREGDGAGGDPVVPLHLEDARMTIDYSDEDFAEDFFGGASLEVVRIERGLADLSGLPTSHAKTVWQWFSFRIGSAEATFTLKFLDSDVANLGGPPSSHLVYSATSKSGPWTLHETTVNPARNTISLTLTEPAHRIFAIAASETYEKWVDFAWDGTETGSISLPYNTLQEALDAVPSEGALNIKGDTADSDSPETFTGAQVIDQAVRITAVGGTVTIGNSAAREAQRGSAKAGFISKKR